MHYNVVGVACVCACEMVIIITVKMCGSDIQFKVESYKQDNIRKKNSVYDRID